MEIDRQALAAPVKNAVDKYQLIPEYLKVRGLVKEHLDSFNFFVRTQIKKIVRANNYIEFSSPDFYLRYKDVRIGEPSVIRDGIPESLNPQICRLYDMTYSAPIYVNIEYMNGNYGTKRIQTKKDVMIGRLPIMLKSCCCVLYGKDEDELPKYGECPLDPGGYFIIKGTEKVILIQEQLSKNRIIIGTDKNGCVQASVTSSTEIRKSKTVITFHRKKIYLSMNQFKNKVPIIIVLKAMGMESDQEIVQMIGRDPRYYELLLPSFEVCAEKAVHTQYQALEFLENNVQKDQNDTRSQKKESAFNILREVLLANIPVHENNLRPKCIYIAVMLRRMIEANINKDTMDDKDYVGNKRLELSGQLLALLFEDLFKKNNDKIREKIEKILESSSRLDISQYIVNDNITNDLERTLSTGNFDLGRFRMHRKGMTQVVARLSYIAALGFMTKINPQFEKSRNVSGPRALQPSQWGMLCPCDTPEGESCGLVKNLALMTHVTIDEDQGHLISLVFLST